MAANIQQIGLVETLGQFSLPLLPAQVEGSSQSFKKSAVLVYSSGKLVEASTNPTAIVGIACAPGQNVTTSPACQVIPIRPNHIFEISIDAALSGSNAPGTGSLAQSNVGTTYGISKDAASGYWYLDTSKSGGNQVATLIGFQTNISSGSNDAGVVNGRALVIFLQSTSAIA